MILLTPSNTECPIDKSQWLSAVVFETIDCFETVEWNVTFSTHKRTQLTQPWVFHKIAAGLRAF